MSKSDTNNNKRLSENDRLYDKLATFYHDEGVATFEHDIEDLQNRTPEALRLLAEDLKENQPHARNEITSLEKCADYLESLHLESKEAYWDIRKRLNFD